jgi:hypothetical protein
MRTTVGLMVISTRSIEYQTHFLRPGRLDHTYKVTIADWYESDWRFVDECGKMARSWLQFGCCGRFMN